MPSRKVKRTELSSGFNGSADLTRHFQALGMLAQRMGGRTGVDAAGGAGQAVGALDAALAHGTGVLVHGLAEGQRAVGPAAAGGGKEKGGVLMGSPPGAQFLDHGRGERNVALLTALATADQQARGLFAPDNIFDPNAGGLPDP